MFTRMLQCKVICPDFQSRELPNHHEAKPTPKINFHKHVCLYEVTTSYWYKRKLHINHALTEIGLRWL